MVRRISAAEAGEHFGDMLQLVTERGDDVVVEESGTPQAALISFAEYQELRKLRPRQQDDWYDRLIELHELIVAEMGEKELPDVDEDLINYGQR